MAAFTLSEWQQIHDNPFVHAKVYAEGSRCTRQADRHLIENVVKQVLAAGLSLLPGVHKEGYDCIPHAPQLQAVTLYAIYLEEQSGSRVIELLASRCQHYLHKTLLFDGLCILFCCGDCCGYMLTFRLRLLYIERGQCLRLLLLLLLLDSGVYGCCVVH